MVMNVVTVEKLLVDGSYGINDNVDGSGVKSQGSTYSY